MKEKMTLHEVMEKLLKESKRPMTAQEIAGVLNEKKW
jgi:predicted Zn-ribbon and HTH transcriptional regulator